MRELIKGVGGFGGFKEIKMGLSLNGQRKRVLLRS